MPLDRGDARPGDPEHGLFAKNPVRQP